MGKSRGTIYLNGLCSAGCPGCMQRGASRDYALNEWELLPTRAGVDLSLQTVHTKTAKLTIDRLTMTGELHDLSDGPHELNNQFDNLSYAALQTELMAMIDARPDDRRETQIQVGMA